MYQRCFVSVELLFDLPVWFDVVRCLETVAVVVGFTVIACSATLAVCSREYDVFRRTSQLMFCVASFMTGKILHNVIISSYSAVRPRITVGANLGFEPTVSGSCHS